MSIDTDTSASAPTTGTDEGPGLEDLATETFATADATIATIGDLLAAAANGNVAAAAEAVRRWRALDCYLTAGENALPARWSRSVAWDSPIPVDAIRQETRTVPGPLVEEKTTLDNDEFGGLFSFDAGEVRMYNETDTPETQTAQVPLRILAPVLPSSPTTSTPIAPAAHVQTTNQPIPPAPLAGAVGRPGAGTPLAEVKQWLFDHMYDKERCPACDQMSTVYLREINDTLVKSLHAMWRYGGIDWFDKRKIKHEFESRDEAFLQHWGIIENQKKRRPDGGKAAFWRVTQTGEDFLHNRIKVPQFAHVYKGQFIKYSGPQISVLDAIEEKFDYNELMARRP